MREVLFGDEATRIADGSSVGEYSLGAKVLSLARIGQQPCGAAESFTMNLNTAV